MQPPPSKRKTAEFRRWKGMNLTDARTDIDDDEVFWLENGISIGKGVIQFLNAAAAPVATIAQGVASMAGFTLNGNPVDIVVGVDGSLTQVSIPGGTTTVIAGANTVTINAHMTIWQGTTILIIDPSTGYHSWNGSTYTFISGAQRGQSIAVFEGRVWIGNNRTITFTAPASFNNFSTADGGGATTITDEAFVGNITAMVSAVEQLWIVGPASIETLSNVAATGASPNVVTTFALTNVVPTVGSTAPNSIIPYFRALAMMSPGGIYAISGVTPQQLSQNIDRVFPGLVLTPDVPAAVALIQNLYCMLFLVTYGQGSVPTLPKPANGSASGTPLVIGFTKGKMFWASQGDTLKWITTVIVNGVSQAWGADGSGHIFQLFGADNNANVRVKVVGKLNAFGKATSMHALYKIGVELEAINPISPTFTIDSEMGSLAIPLVASMPQTFVNQQNQTVVFVNSSNQTVTFVGQGLSTPKQDAAMFGHYLGWTYECFGPPHRLQAIQMEYAETRDWNP